MVKEKSVFDDLAVKIKKYRPTIEDIGKYIAAQHAALVDDPKGSLSLNQYLKNIYFPDKNVVVAADLSNMIFGVSDNITDTITDLSGGDFTGCIFKNTTFRGCNLEDAVFCDVDFNQAYFENTVLRNVDFRGADLANCQFSEDYKGYSQMGKEHDIEGIKFSTTSSLGRKYADIKSDLVRQKEQKELINSKTKEVADAYANLSYMQQAKIVLKRETGNQQYDRLVEELKLMVEQKIFPRKDNVMHKTFQNIFGSESCIFDPAYVRGSTKEQRDQETQYVRLAREDIEKYLEARKDDKDLSLNDFAKSKLEQSQIKAGARIIADCSSRVDTSTNNEWHDRVDLSGLDFSGADLRGAVFSGSVLSGCAFNGTDVSEASFEGAELVAANFVGVKADNANFFNSNLSKSTVTDKSQFVHAFMSGSNGQEVLISDSNFDYANIKNGNWDRAKFTNSTFNHANLEGISLISADLRKVQMQHAILEQAILMECKVIDSDLSNALMSKAKAHKAQFQNTILNGIEGKGINLSEAELDSFVKLDEANLEKAILTKINAEGVNFIRANMNMVDAQNANFRNTILEDVNMKCANLTKAVFEGAKLHGINLSYSTLKEVYAKKADFSNSIIRCVEAQQADFTEVNFTNADLTRSNLQKAILEKVQAEKVRLEGVNLRAAKLAEANMAKAIIDVDTNIIGSDLRDLQGKFIQNGQEITPQKLQEQQIIIEQVELQRKKDNSPNIAVGLLKEAGAFFLDAINVLPSTVKSMPDVNDMYANFLKFQEVSSNLSSGELLVETRQKLQTEQVEYASHLIKGAGTVLDRHVASLNEEQSNLLKDIIAKYAVLPVLKAVLNPVVGKKKVGTNILDEVDKDFIRRIVPLSVNLVSGVLEGESNKKVQEICKNLIIPDKKSGRNIIKNALEIFVSPQVVAVVKKDLVEFLRNPVNQKEITQIARYILDDKFTRFVSKEFLDDTISLAINASSTILDHTPKVVGIYESYMKHQDLALELLIGGGNLSSDRKEEIILTQKFMVSSIVDNIDKVVQSLSYDLKNTLPQYFVKNKGNILEFLDKPEVQQNLRFYGLNPKFVYDATAATIPFIVDVLPILTELTENCLKDRDGLRLIIEQTKDTMNAPESEQSEKVSKLVDSLIKFNKDNPDVKKVLQKEIPDLLIKHAKDLGPVVEKFLNETKMGKKLKLKGEAVVKVLGDHSKDLGAITTAYSKKEYGAMVRPLMGLLFDKKVLTLAVGAVASILNHNFQKHFVSNSTRRKVIGEEMSKMMVDILLNLKPNDKRDLSKIFQERAYQYSQEARLSNEYSPILDYSLSNKDLRGLSFETIDMNLDNFEVEGFNFNKVTLGKCSIKGAVLKGCSFKKAIFKEHIDFEGATIDGSTLITLLPAIQEYNKKHPEKTMNLDKIKVVGDIKEEDKANPLLENADLTKATVKKIEIASPVPASKLGQAILIERSKREHSGTLAK
ncbi:pentapeptide repeat-containing protein [Candidatus Tisiphia endosymbiont of Mystacides longicornis]|uniref:pentapeptide repeat-containing protein n=1 Tax=Candidatus Tisiphia endosymbiont of Mystacides longicornis TaxID=3139330 RepID=UPI003CCAB273